MESSFISSTANTVAWIPGRHTVVTINKYTIIKASPSDFGFLPNPNIIASHIPDFLTLPSSPQEGAQISVHQNLQTQEGDKRISQIQKLCSVSPSEENGNKNDSSPDIDSTLPEESQPYDQTHQDSLLTIPDDNPYLRRSVRNLRYHQPVDIRVLKVSSGISIKRALQLDERKTVNAIINEVKNMLDYKVGHYVHITNLTYDQHKNILRSFMFLPNGDMNKLKARLVADGSQHGRHLYEFVSSATISLQVVFM
jgi:hypothetical protein